jgi:hypothetical protein
MGQQRAKWGQVKRYFERRGYLIYSDGGDSIIQAPKDNTQRSRQQVRIGHRFSNHAGDELRSGHLGAIKRAFNVMRDNILND